MDTQTLLDVNALSVFFKDKDRLYSILDKVSFSLKKGEILGIVGESGCGKTMLGNSIIGLYPSNMKDIKGGIKFQNTALLSLAPEARKEYRGKHISMIFQNPNTSLNPVFSIGRQMTDIIREHKKISKSKAKTIVLSWLEEVGLSEAERVYHSFPHQLSGGMKQRVVIAMALSCGAELVIADEPTTALDVTTQFQILELIKRLQKEHNTSILLVTHNMGVAAYTCNRIMVMYGGHIVELGDANEILNDPRHPYTRGLLKCLPGSGKKVEDLFTIPGVVPAASDFPVGCRFYSRCSRGISQCKDNKPELQPLSQESLRSIACFNPEEEGAGIE